MEKTLKAFLFSLLVFFVFFGYPQNYIRDFRFGDCGSGRPPFDFSKSYELVDTRVLSNGKILSIGNARNDSGRIYLLMIQYLHNGKLDSVGFGTNGIVEMQTSYQSVVKGTMIANNGKIILVGYVNDSTLPAGRIPAVFRFHPNGFLDSSFNSNGIYTSKFDGSSAGMITHSYVLNDSLLWFSGSLFVSNGNGGNGIGLMQMNNNGTPFSPFGNIPGMQGRSAFYIDSLLPFQVFSAAGKTVLTLLQTKGPEDTIKLARFTSNGYLDSSFGINGIKSSGVRSENVVSIQLADGNIVIGGTTNEPGQPKQVQLLKYIDSLLPYTSFGTNGKVILPTIGPSNYDNVLRSISPQADGKLLLLGYLAPMGSLNLRPFIMRLLPNGKIDSTFNGNGTLQPAVEINQGWNNIDSTDSIEILTTRDEDFEMIKYVPDTSLIQFSTTAAFNYDAEKLKVYFNNLSRNASSYYWDFGDGNYSDQENPSHQYLLPGQYQVSLQSFSNCGEEMISTKVEVPGLYKVMPSIASNKGFVATTIFGYGFNNSSKVLLVNAALPTLSADTIFYDSVKFTLQANFHFNNADTGIYDIIVITGTHRDTLRSGIELQLRDVGKPWVKITGPHTFKNYTLVGRYASFKVEYGFTGNSTRYMVPVAIVIQGKGLLPEIVTPLANRSDTTGLPDSVKPHPNGFYQVYDRVNNDSVWVLYLTDVVVHPGEDNVFDFSVIARSLNKFKIRVYIGTSLFDRDQLDTLYHMRANISGCDNKCLECLLDLAGYIPGPFGCAAGILSLTCKIDQFEITPETKFGQVFDLGLDFASTIVGCGSLAGGTFGKLFDDIAESIFGFALEQKGNLGNIEDCASAVSGLASSGSCSDPGGEDSGKYDPLSSWDPNTKIGPGHTNTQHYIGKREQLPYTIHFENLAAASSPALEVEIVDTMDKSKIDIQTFRFGSINIAGNSYPVFNDRDRFITDVPMPSKGIFVRVNGHVDTTTGVATWKFTSLDTTTMSLVDDPLKGFLPPNIDSVQGTGYVSFHVSQHTSNTHLTSINNQAKIVFDINPPINTPVWTCIVDTIKPTSQVSNVFRVLNDSTFVVKWSGADAHSGIRNFKIAASENDSPYTVIATFSGDSTLVKGKVGNTYKFFSIASDTADNWEDPPANPVANPDAMFVFNAPLPIRLIYFTAQKKNEFAQLDWMTATEQNAKYFVVEHSTNGVIFHPLDSVKAVGNSVGERRYSYLHKEPKAGRNFYRLRIVHTDHNIKYSHVRSVLFEKNISLTLRPNPAYRFVDIFISEPGGLLRIVNGEGKIIKSMGVTSKKISLDLSKDAAGLYIVIYTSRNKQMIKEVLILDK